MRRLAVCLLSLTAIFASGLGCGESEGGSETAGAAGQMASGTAGGSSAGQGGAAASGSSAGGSASAGKPSTGGNATSGGSAGGSSNDAGAGNETGGAGGGAGLVDCDPKKILCKRVAPECAAGEVPSVDGSCYGDCVKIDRCACNDAAQCPESNQYTCWAKNHCGPYVR